MKKQIESRITAIRVNKSGQKIGFIENPTSKKKDDAYYFDSRCLLKGISIDDFKENDIVLFETRYDHNAGKTKVYNLTLKHFLFNDTATTQVIKKNNHKPLTPPIPFKTEKEIFSGSSFHGEKSSAKVVGVKSVFYHDEKIVTTSFGKGNKAVMEKVLFDGDIQNIHNPAVYDMDYNKRQLHFRNSKTNNEAVITNPANMKITADGLFNLDNVGIDQTRLKVPLEESIFGKVYSDNIHIQVAYNILDIEKILAQHIGNIIYSLNNIIADETHSDFIGNMGFIKEYSKFTKTDKQYDNFQKFISSPKLACFGNAFYFPKGKSAERKPKEDIYYMLLLCGAIRQFCAHQYDKYKLAIYNFENDNKFQYINDFLDRLYDSKIKDVNNSFWSTSGKSMDILLNVFNISSQALKKEFVKDYYDFTVTKDYKNLGLSLKVLRETMLSLPEAESLRKYVDNNQNSRRFIYKAIDFILFKDYKDYAAASGIIESLRACKSKEEKVSIYQNESRKAWDRNGALIKDSVIKIVDDKIEERIKTQSLGIDKSVLAGIKLESRNISSFTKLIYMITMLLDGKEINDLLTTLVSKFENIHSLCTVYNEITGSTMEFAQTHRMFANSDKIADELRAVNSFARMEKALVKTPKYLFMEAAKVLGTNKTESTLEKYFDQMLDKSNADKGLRNFIVNNVMESSRFLYLVRYTDTNTICKLAQNDNLISFVLSGIPQLQIDRYYISCGGKLDNTAPKEKIEFLINKIKNVRFENFENIKQGNNASAKEKIEKELAKNVIGLYLTYLYLVTKNLVNINSRYFMAFHCLERDSAFKGHTLDNYYNRCFDITKEFITETGGKAILNKKACSYMAVNISNTDSHSVKVFRNTVDHLSAIRKAYIYVSEIKNIKSYYSLYHYMVQREVFKYVTSGVTIEKYKDLVIDNGTYNKDMVKALCSPFGYNLPRFKNLTIEDLFDKNKHTTLY